MDFAYTEMKITSPEIFILNKFQWIAYHYQKCVLDQPE